MSNSIRFQDPPLNEVVIGIQFTNLNWEVNNYGEYYSEVKDNFPKIKSVAPLPKGTQQPGFQFLAGAEMPRAWFSEDSGPYLIQVQPDRFFLNWRKKADAVDYPYFDFFYKRFSDEFEVFQKFCEKQELGDFKIQRFELTYINHLESGKHWNVPSDLSKWFTHLDCLDSFQETKVFGLDLSYLAGDVFVNHSIKKGTKGAGGEELFVIDLGINQVADSFESVTEKIKLSNDILSSEFERLTTAEAHKEWGKSN